MWVQLFWMSALLGFCNGAGMWWWKRSETHLVWCEDDRECHIGGKTYLNEACVHQRWGKDYRNHDEYFRFFHSYYDEDPWTKEKMVEILKLHNTYRNSVAGGSEGLPQASNMRQMTWDDELAFSAFHTAKAASLAEETRGRSAEYRPVDFDIFPTTPCLRTSRFEQASQIRFSKYLAVEDVKDSIFDFYKKIISQPQDTIKSLIPKYSKPDNQSAEYLARLLWANSYKIGCIDKHISLTITLDEARQYSRTYVCNYAPEATIEGQPVYKEGEKCSACPTGTKCRPDSAYPYLCATDDDPMSDELLNLGTTQSGPLTLIYPFLFIMIAINCICHS